MVYFPLTECVFILIGAILGWTSWFWDNLLFTHCLSASPICEFLANWVAVCVSKILRFQSPNIVVQLILTASLILIQLHLFVPNLQFIADFVSDAPFLFRISTTSDFFHLSPICQKARGEVWPSWVPVCPSIANQFILRSSSGLSQPPLNCDALYVLNCTFLHCVLELHYSHYTTFCKALQ